VIKKFKVQGSNLIEPQALSLNKLVKVIFPSPGGRGLRGGGR
jgi:hypothetical protein